MTMKATIRCWKYGTACCRAQGGNILRRGDHVYRYCDDPAHDPRQLRDHLDAIDACVEEAAADLQLDEDTVWHDVAVAYVECEVHDPSMRTEVARCLGIPADVFVARAEAAWEDRTERTNR